MQAIQWNSAKDLHQAPQENLWQTSSLQTLVEENKNTKKAMPKSNWCEKNQLHEKLAKAFWKEKNILAMAYHQTKIQKKMLEAERLEEEKMLEIMEEELL